MKQKETSLRSTDPSGPNAWRELAQLCKKMRFWLYRRKRTDGAERYLDRLEDVLRRLPQNDMAILRQEGLALLFELEGEIDKAIAHRKREIRLMERLHKHATSPRYTASTRAYMLRDRGAKELEERRKILADLVEMRSCGRKRVG